MLPKVIALSTKVRVIAIDEKRKKLRCFCNIADANIDPVPSLSSRVLACLTAEYPPPPRGDGLSKLTYRADLSRLTYSGYYVPAVQSRLSNVLSSLSCSSRPVNADLSHVSCLSYPAPAVLSRMPCLGSPVTVV